MSRPLMMCCLLLTAVMTFAGRDVLAQTEHPLILAHRGGVQEFEENTMEGFRGCYERGIRGFETDIRMTKDGVLVILHDDTLDRTHSGHGSIEHQTADELKDVVTKKGQKLLFFEEFLDYFADKPDAYIELEMKTSNRKLYPDDRIDTYCHKLYEMAEARKAKGSTYVYSSFDERPIKVIHQINPQAPLSLIVGKPCTPELIQLAKSLGADRIACQLNGTSRAAVQEAHKNGLMINCWPGKSVQDYYLATGLGIDVHCTDHPLLVQAAAKSLK